MGIVEGLADVRNGSKCEFRFAPRERTTSGGSGMSEKRQNAEVTNA
jgi:hypothetical protein